MNQLYQLVVMASTQNSGLGNHGLYLYDLVSAYLLMHHLTAPQLCSYLSLTNASLV